MCFGFNLFEVTLGWISIDIYLDSPSIFGNGGGKYDYMSDIRFWLVVSTRTPINEILHVSEVKLKEVTHSVEMVMGGAGSETSRYSNKS